MTERWLPVPGYESCYEVSSLGRFRRSSGGQGAVAGRLISTRRRNHKGYVVVELSRANEKRRFLAHTLVAQAFLGEPRDGEMVNHRNGVKDDNNAANLEWVTAAENARHASAMGLLSPQRGERNGRAVLSADDVAAIRKDPRTQRVIARDYGISKSQVGNIKRGEQWTGECPRTADAVT